MIHHEIQIVNTQIYFFICCSNSVIFDVNLLYSFVNKSCIIILRIFLYNEFSSVISHVKCPFFSKSLPLLIVQTFPRINTHLSAKPSHLLFYPKHWNLLLPYNILPWKFMDLLYDKLLHNLTQIWYSRFIDRTVQCLEYYTIIFLHVECRGWYPGGSIFVSA